MEIKTYCKENKITYTELANRLKVSKQRLQHWVKMGYLYIDDRVVKVIWEG